jgi:hypothetical protein
LALRGRYLITDIAKPKIAYAPLLLCLLFQEEASADITFEVVGPLLVPLPLINRANSGLNISQLLQNLLKKRRKKKLVD